MEQVKEVRAAQLPGLKISTRMMCRGSEQWVSADSGELEFAEPGGFIVSVDSPGETEDLTADDALSAFAYLYDLVEDLLLKKVFETREKVRALLAREEMDMDI